MPVPRNILFPNGEILAVAQGFMVPECDTAIPTYGATTDTWVFSKNGTTVATVTISYTDGTKATVSSIVRT